ncbi:hypothetical protein BCR36DRAFT_580755 [Piromyces finnis]|uniref:Uncharacterized protein n=1 Tax=Piromyces finnis TaxID=1754191 RepID=A0A1Y1VJ24_9FUNG|nr:hypothetical protein BCR36DRAFT_580755 [Piromyces finnis]|eukprot:ORX57348.1 hypothetical protein BCR36DRAFT_580755 [Piromyces finnis]
MIIKGDLKFKKLKKIKIEKDQNEVIKYKYEAYYFGLKIVETKYYLKKKIALKTIKKISKDYLRMLKQEFKNSNEDEEGEIDSNKLYNNKADEENQISFLPEQLEINNQLMHSRTYVVYLNQFFQKFKIDYEYSFENYKNLYLCKLRIDNKYFVTDRPFIRKVDAKEEVSKIACDYLKII